MERTTTPQPQEQETSAFGGYEAALDPRDWAEYVRKTDPEAPTSYYSDTARHFRNLLTLLRGEIDYRRIENGSFMPLVIERLSPTEISMAHYGTSEADLMADPEIVFSLSADAHGTPHAEPGYYRNSYIGVEHFTITVAPWTLTAVSYRPDMHRGLLRFTNEWFDRLNEQGYFSVSE